VEILVIRKAPLGDPVEIKINGFLLSLRLEEARFIYVKAL
ncbi:MAG: ferrous iron transport protein A, partial [Bacteroidetes bacterium]|nr:ferrous iron transport protein A [Bacteroidota bacterium]